ncbi:MAG: histidine kinase, partial [Proteobacteria bacterium]|nr:histidine kinase [Pseudomonadota bacterium]
VGAVALIIIIFLLFNSYRLVQNKAKLRLEKHQAETENRLLRSQMNPHFIFNSLYSIQGFIAKKDTKIAENYLVDFAILIRSILTNSSESFIPLEKELESLELYMKLEQLRFKNKFEFTIDIDESVEEEFILVPPMLIQPFIENSISHGIFPKSGKGNIIIKMKDQGNSLFCSVIDNGIGREEAMKRKENQNKEHKSLAIEITKNRLGLLGKELGVKTSLDIFDLTDDSDKSIGTQVDIAIPIKDA